MLWISDSESDNNSFWQNIFTDHKSLIKNVSANTFKTRDGRIRFVWGRVEHVWVRKTIGYNYAKWKYT